MAESPSASRPSTRNPVNGPAMLFFSGGSVLGSLARVLVRQTHRSTHVMSPFDNGGSSTELRRHFGMISVGDIRGRLLSLADLDRQGVRAAHSLLNSRLDLGISHGELLRQLRQITSGDDKRIQNIPSQRNRLIKSGLRSMLDRLPPGFDLAGASLGSLVLTGLVFDAGKSLGTAIDQFGSILSTRGMVRPASRQAMDLAVSLSNGEEVFGQQSITEIDHERPTASIARLWFTEPGTPNERPAPPADSEVLKAISGAELICFPYGNFWTGLVASLQPKGIVEAIRASARPKVWVPPTWPDPEVAGMRLEEMLDHLLVLLGVKPGSDEVKHVLNYIIVDPRMGRYQGGLSTRALKARKIQVIESELIHRDSAPAIDADRLVAILAALC